jgi:hypothetical protein
MPPELDSPNTPWRAGSFRGATGRLLFGAMYEDPAIELEAFAAHCRVFCIAGAGLHGPRALSGRTRCHSR